MSRPVPYRVRPTRIAWVDYASGVGVDPDGRSVLGRRAAGGRHVTLVELLDLAQRVNADRVYLTGRRPAPRWQEAPVPPGWTHSLRGHFYDSDDPCGRYERAGWHVQVRRAAPYLGDVTPAVAAAVWAELGRRLPWVFRDDRARLFDSPTATGQQLWALSLPAGWDGAQVDSDTAGLLRATSPQHRMEVTAGCYGGCAEQHWRPAGKTVREAHYLDGRLMYASLLRELRAGAAQRLTGREAEQFVDADPYERVRLHVTATVPAGWEHVGLLLAKHPDGVHWHAPSAAGVTFDTWCDAAEWKIAAGAGWPMTIREGLRLGGGTRIMDTWRDRMLRLYASFTGPTAEHAAGRHAVRAMIVSTIGGFHSTGRDRTIRVDSPSRVPAGVPFDLRADGSAVYRQRAALTGNAAAYAHPEISAQVWARAHTRLLWHRATGTGALAVPGTQVLGMWGDALYLAADPRWPDDGGVGRLRTKGSTTGRIRRPTTLTQLNQLRIRIEKGAAP